MWSSSAQISFIQNQTNRYGALLIWIVGVLGNILTILTLSSTKQFRSNTYSIFMIATSAINTFIVAHQIGLIFVSTFLNFSPRTTLSSWCKAFAYTYYTSGYMSITLLALATIDRWLITSRNIRLRNFSSVRHARIAIVSVVVFYSLLLIPHPIYSEILFDPTRNATTCDRPPGMYRTYVNYGLVLFVHVFSVAIMVVFGLLTHHHLVNGNPLQGHGGVTIKQRINTQMTKTLFLQIILFITYIIPNWVITILYPAFTANITQRSAERIAIEMLANNISTLLYNVCFADTFCVLFIVSPAFRRNVKLLFRPQHYNNQIIPHLPFVHY